MCIYMNIYSHGGFPADTSIKEPTCQYKRHETWVWSLGQEDPLEKGIATHPLQYSCLRNPMDKGAWRTTIHRVTKSWTQLKRLGTHAYSHRPPQALTSQQCIYIFPGHNYSFSHFTSKISCKLFQTLCGTREYKYYTPRKKMFRLKL